jgi:hypothetical protein
MVYPKPILPQLASFSKGKFAIPTGTSRLERSRKADEKGEPLMKNYIFKKGEPFSPSRRDVFEWGHRRVA